LGQASFLFQSNETPPTHKNMIYGFQWVMIAIPSVVVFSTLCSTALGLDPPGPIKSTIPVAISNFEWQSSKRRFPRDYFSIDEFKILCYEKW
jgi:hypothetical protein